jgi:hypothetical protein
MPFLAATVVIFILPLASLVSHKYVAYKCALFYGGAWNLVGDVLRSMSWR